MKKCSICGILKNESEFYSKGSVCKECYREKSRQRYLTKREDPVFAEKERVRSMEKYYRLNYKDKYSTKGKTFEYDDSERERTCITCGRTLPINHFYKHCGYYLRECKWCKNSSASVISDKIVNIINNEEWRDLNVKGKNIKVSNLGRISYERDRIEYLVSQQQNTDGYLTCRYGLVHRLVAMAFIDNIPEDKEINHIDGNKQNNCVENLEIVTHKQNMRHAKDVLGIPFNAMKGKRGKQHPESKAVVCKDKDGNIINEYESIHLAAEATGNTVANISSVCHHKYGCKTCGGYIWEFKQ